MFAFLSFSDLSSFPSFLTGFSFPSLHSSKSYLSNHCSSPRHSPRYSPREWRGLGLLLVILLVLGWLGSPVSAAQAATLSEVAIAENPALGETVIQPVSSSVTLPLTPSAPLAPHYKLRKRPSADGIGKTYMGREIAQVMGHRAAMWLERPSRLLEERPDLLVQLLNLPSDAIVADIGAGTGIFSVRMARKVPEGKVLAVDLQPEMLDILDFFKEEENLENIETIQATETDPRLPDDTVDLALVVDAYHEFEFPREVMEGVVRSLKPSGQVVLAEYRGENPLIAIKPHHKMTQRQVRKEMKAVGLVWDKTDKSLPQQHLIFFRKKGES